MRQYGFARRKALPQNSISKGLPGGGGGGDDDVLIASQSRLDLYRWHVGARGILGLVFA